MRGTPNSSFSYPVTFACRNEKLYGLRETSGRFRISASLMVRPRSILPGSAIGASPLTETTSATPPTSSVKLRVAVCPAESFTPVRSAALKPWISARTV